MKTDDLDIVYIVRPGESNEELRYSLRSVAKNFPHRNIFIAGYKPSWVKNVTPIPVHQTGTKYQNAEANWQAAMADNRISRNFVLFNDDFFILQPVTELPNYHRGKLADVIAHYHELQPGGAYVTNMARTAQMLDKLGVKQQAQFSYALHVPMIMNREKRQLLYRISELLNPEKRDIQMRTLYGCFYRIGGIEIKDVKLSKVEHTPTGGETFLSSLDNSFKNGKVGTYLRNTFTEKCRYEL